MSDKEIERLDFILDKMIEMNWFVSANELHTQGLYDYLNDNTENIEKDFRKLINVFRKLNMGELSLTADAEMVRPNENSIEFQENGGFKGYYKRLEESKQKSQLDSIKETERQELKDKIDILTLEGLQHKDKIRKQEDDIRDLTHQLTRINLLKAYWWVIGIGFTIGGIIGGIIVKLLSEE